MEVHVLTLPLPLRDVVRRIIDSKTLQLIDDEAPKETGKENGQYYIHTQRNKVDDHHRYRSGLQR